MIDRFSGITDSVDIPPRWSSNADRVVYLLAKYRAGVYIAGIGIILLFATGRLGIPELPPWVRTVLTGIVIGIVPSMILGVHIISRILPDPRVKVMEISTDPPEIEPVRIPRRLWKEREVEDMPIWQINAGETEAVVTNVEHLEEVGKLKVRGLNPELADPTSIAARDGKLDKIFNELVENKRDLNAHQATEGLRQIEIEGRAFNAITEAVEKGTSINPGAFEEIIKEQQPDEPNRPRSDRTTGDPQREGERPSVNDLIQRSGTGKEPKQIDNGQQGGQ